MSIEGSTSDSLSVQVSDNYAEHPLVIGPGYQPKDIRCSWATYLGKNTSGVLRMYLCHYVECNVMRCHLFLHFYISCFPTSTPKITEGCHRIDRNV